MSCAARNCYSDPVDKDPITDEEFCQQHMDQLVYLHVEQGKPIELAISILVD